MTYHDGDSNKLGNRHKSQQSADKRPSRLTLVLSTSQNYNEADHSSQTQQRGEGDHEADSSPHGAKVSLPILTELLRWEVPARRVVQRGAAPVKADVFLNRVARGRCYGVSDPLRHPY